MAGTQGQLISTPRRSSRELTEERRTTTSSTHPWTRSQQNQDYVHHNSMGMYLSNVNQLRKNDYDSAKGNLKNSTNSSEDDERPNKLFPVQSERDELLRKVRAVLNKVSSVNYNRLRKRWLNLMPGDNTDQFNSDSEPRLKMNQIGEVLRLVIAKALDDTIYMHIYAGLMGYVVAKKEASVATKIRQLIAAQLHHELKGLTTDKELALFHRTTPLVDATRRKKVTLHRFVAELYCEKAISSRFLYQRVMDSLIGGDIDENVECLCVLMTFAGRKLEEVKQCWVDEIFSKLTELQNELISKRNQFMILDLMEMRSSGWCPHNKWWSPSVQRGPERERTRSSPSGSKYKPPQRRPKKKTRTRSESSIGVEETGQITTTGKQDQQQQQHNIPLKVQA